jgi:hypothetical protein
MAFTSTPIHCSLKTVTHTSLPKKAVGDAVGVAVVGTAVGAADGVMVGIDVGKAVGVIVGIAVGDAVGTVVGTAVGLSVGAAVGACVGASVGASELQNMVPSEHVIELSRNVLHCPFVVFLQWPRVPDVHPVHLAYPTARGQLSRPDPHKLPEV